MLRGVFAYLGTGTVRKGGLIVVRFETRKRREAEEFLERFGFPTWREKTYGRSTVKFLEIPEDS